MIRQNYIEIDTLHQR